MPATRAQALIRRESDMLRPSAVRATPSSIMAELHRTTIAHSQRCSNGSRFSAAARRLSLHALRELKV